MTRTLDTTAEARRDELVDRVFQAVIGAQDVMHVYLGHKLGLYAALADMPPATPAELAERAGIAPRYAREWLEQQAVSGMLDVTEDTGDPETRRYRMPPGGKQVFCDPDSLTFMAPLASIAVGMAQAMPQVVEAFQTGGGVPYSAYGPELRVGIAEANRPMYSQQLAAEWLRAMPDIEERLRRTDRPARVADLGCGEGWSSISLALAYPNVRVDGVDTDEASIVEARGHAMEAGVADRVTFYAEDAANGRLDPYDLVTMFETFHDMSRPVEVLRSVHHMLTPGGAVLIADEKVAENFTAPGGDTERFHYGWSAPHCLAAALVDPEAAGTGTVLRPAKLREYATEAGFDTVTVLPIEHDTWRFYRLDP